ncbi:unnamed protein product [Bursaphelenchus okinawaensis]|uniref:Uncharacterized protein n=1 Tax=Bursaphelenchus okinawaensis TaxID=465554 RepID=A0A811LR85_9BILA|nr:unnamed protein product [Bursaphelenchus okinawaensis]CAG9127313.1 unnamed protein product [Bursaphelenchus okinawaensis]
MDSSQKIYDINMEEEYIEPLTDELTPNEASTSKEVSPTLQNETSAEQVDVSEEVADQSVRDSLPEEAVLSQTSNSKPNSTAKTNNKNKRKSKAKATKKKKAWEADDSDGHEDPDPQLDPVKIDYEALCTDPKYDNEGDVWVWDAHQFTYQSIRRFGLRNPIVFTGQQDVLGVEIPDIDYNGITDNIDPATKIDVFDHKSEKLKICW